MLQKQLQLSEPDAFRWIQKTAMDLRLSMRQVADGVITHGPGIAAGRRPGLSQPAARTAQMGRTHTRAIGP